MAPDPKLEAFKKYLAEQIQSDAAWRITTGAGYWVCPYCGTEGAHAPSAEHDAAAVVKEVMGHLIYRCQKFRGGKGQPKSPGRLKEYARLLDFNRVVRRSPAWRITDDESASGKPSLGTLGKMLRHLDSMPTVGGPDGETSRRRRPELQPILDEAVLRLSVKLHRDPAYRAYDVRGRWYDPFTLKPSDVRLSGKRISPGQIEATHAHLGNSVEYQVNKGVPPHDPSAVQDAVRRGNKRMYISAKASRLMQVAPVWSRQTEDGFWICPFCREGIEHVDVRTPFLRRQIAPRQVGKHLVEECPAFRGGVEPATSAGDLGGQPIGGSQSDRHEQVSYAAAAEALDSIQRGPGTTPEQAAEDLKAVLDARPSEADWAKQQEQQAEAKEAMERARQIQLGMLPKTPEIEGFELAVIFNSCDEVSGDFYDFMPVSEHELGIVIGDVSGHGVHAALVMAAAKTALKIHGKGVSSPKRALCLLNEDLKPTLPSNVFVTIWYGILDLRTLTLTHARAGHNPLYVVNPQPVEAEDGTSDFLQIHKPKGMIVGMAPGPIFEKTLAEERIKLRAGDTLVQTTDGITEAMDQERNEYTEERLEDLLRDHAIEPADQLLETILGDLQAHCRGAEQQDDITMFAIRYLGGREATEEADPLPAEPVAAHEVTPSEAELDLGEELLANDSNAVTPVPASESAATALPVDTEEMAYAEAIPAEALDGDDPFAPILPDDEDLPALPGEVGGEADGADPDEPTP